MQKQIHFSADFISILNQIKGASVIAGNLLDLSFDYYSHPTKEDCIDYIAISNDNPGMLSYLTPERVDYIKNNTEDFQFEVWNSKRRYRAKPSSVVLKILTSVTAKDIEIFNNLFKSAAGLIKFEFSVVSEEDIRKFYHHAFGENSGSLGASCMKHDFCQDFLDIYVDNPEIISMLIMLDFRKKLIGRALLWNFDGEKVMDRIYTSNDEELSYHFKIWAKDNGYIYKTAQKWNNTLLFEDDGNTVKKRFSVKLKDWKYSKFPYLDTFKFLNYKTGIISNYKSEDTEKVLIGSEGGWSGPTTLEEDYFDSLYHHQNEMVPIKYDAETKKLRDKDVYTHQSNTLWSEINSMYIRRQDAFNLDILHDNLFKPELNCFNRLDILKSTIQDIAKKDFVTFLNILSRKQSVSSLILEKSAIKIKWSSDQNYLESVVNEFYSDMFESNPVVVSDVKPDEIEQLSIQVDESLPSGTSYEEQRLLANAGNDSYPDPNLRYTTWDWVTWDRITNNVLSIARSNYLFPPSETTDLADEGSQQGQDGRNAVFESLSSVSRHSTSGRYVTDRIGE